MTDPTQISELRGAPLAQAVAEYITAHPEEWDQEQWGYKTHCGTTAWFAGWTVILTGGAAFAYGCLVSSGLSIPQRASLLLGGNFDNLFFWEPDEDYRVQLENNGMHASEASGMYAPIQDKLVEMWKRVAAYYPKGDITIPEDYR